MGTCVYTRKRQMRPKSYKLLIQNMFTCVNAAYAIVLRHRSHLGVMCHLFSRCKAAFALPIAYPDLAEG
jgi:hypothetical protein